MDMSSLFSSLYEKVTTGVLSLPKRTIKNILDPDVFKYLAVAGISTAVGYVGGVLTIEALQNLLDNQVLQAIAGGYGGFGASFVISTLITKPLLLLPVNKNRYYPDGNLDLKKYLVDQLKVIRMSSFTHIIVAIGVPPIQSVLLYSGVSAPIAQLVGSGLGVGFKVLYQSNIYPKIINED